MGEPVILTLLLITKKALDVALEKGIAISVAVVHRNKKTQFKYKVSDWNSRPEFFKDEEGGLDETE